MSNFYKTPFSLNEPLHAFFGLWGVFLTSNSLHEVKNNYAYVIMQDICKKYIEVNFYVGCMVSQPNRLQHHWTFVKYLLDIFSVFGFDQ